MLLQMHTNRADKPKKKQMLVHKHTHTHKKPTQTNDSSDKRENEIATSINKCGLIVLVHVVVIMKHRRRPV